MTTRGAIGGLVCFGLGAALGAMTQTVWARGPRGGVPDRVAAAPIDHSRLDKLDRFARAVALIEARYVRPIDGEILMDGAIRGLVSVLDPHSQYLTREDAQMLDEDLGGRFGGVGLVVVMERASDGTIVLSVREVVAGGPAAAAGIEIGDEIVSIEDKPVAAFIDVSDAVSRMRGKVGTAVRFELRRGEALAKPMSLERAMVAARAVDARHLGVGLWVIRLREFQHGAAEEIHDTIRAARDHEEHGPLRGVVLDLRDNGGGLLVEAIAVADLFVRSGVIVRTRGRGYVQTGAYSATLSGTIDDVPLVVLVNKGTASASEIVAGALQDHGRALVVGERTYGKGSVQTPMRLGEGTSLKLTTELYYTPRDRLIQAAGITPDLWVGTRPAPRIDSRPELPAEATLPRHLEPEADRPADDLRGELARVLEEIAPLGEARPEAEGPSSEAASPTSARGDAQLRVAVEVLAAVARLGHSELRRDDRRRQGGRQGKRRGGGAAAPGSGSSATPRPRAPATAGGGRR